MEIEYVEKHPTPRPDNCLLHDDWVSSVSVCKKWYVINIEELSRTSAAINVLIGGARVHRVMSILRIVYWMENATLLLHF